MKTRFNARRFIPQASTIFSFFVFLIIIGVGISVLLSERRNFYEALIEKGESLTSFMAKVAPPAYLTYDIAMLDSYVEEVVKDKEVRYAAFMDDQGNLIASFPYPVKGIKTHTNINKRTLKEEIIIVENGADVVEIQAPIFYLDRTLGSAKIGLSKELLNSKVSRESVVIFIITSLGILFAAWRFKMINAQLTRKVKERTKALEQEILVRREAEEQLIDFTKKLKKSNNDLHDFASICSHDLQEPLRKVTTFGERLRSKIGNQLDDQGRDYFNRMQNATKRMQSLIVGLLEFSRVTTHAKPFVPVDLSKVAEEVVSDLEVRIGEKKARVDIAKLAIIEADPLQMRQLFQNLIGNALKFNREDDPPVITVSGERICQNGGSISLEMYKLTVTDNGIGFDERYKDRIFGVFQRLHTVREHEGSGVGLSICQKIVERHGGNIEAKSTLGRGTEFVVLLPLNHSGITP